MKTNSRLAGFAIVLAGVGVSTAMAQAGMCAIDGRWDASLVRPNGDTVPFRLDISGDGANTRGTFYKALSRSMAVRLDCIRMAI